MLTILIVVAGDQLEDGVDAMGMKVTDNFFGVGLDRLEGLDPGLGLLVTKQEISLACLGGDRL